MTVQEFKERFPHLAHLEGNELWDAMAVAVWKENPVLVEPLPDDHEIAYTQDIGDGYTVSVTKGMDRTWKKFMEGAKPLEFKNFGFLIPGGAKEQNKGGA